MSHKSAHKYPWKISDVVLFPLFFGAVALEFFYPTKFVHFRFVFAVIGAGTIVFGFLLINQAKMVFDLSHQPWGPGKPTTRLISRGPYRVSRNPQKLGALIIGIGAAMAFDSLWLLLGVPLAALLLELWLIRPEERYLKATFGDSYATYAASTHRWIGWSVARGQTPVLPLNASPTDN